MHLYELLSCFALISSPFVCVLVHVTQAGYPFWCYGDTLGSPFRLGTRTGRFSVGDMEWTFLRSSYALVPRKKVKQEKPCQVRPLLHLPLLKGVLAVPSIAKQTCWMWEVG